MAKVFGSLDTLSNAHSSEQKVACVLQKHLQDDVLVWHEPSIGNLKPDFLILFPSRGFVIMEVKSWDIGYIREADDHTVVLNSDPPRNTKHPVKEQGKNYEFKVVDILTGSKFMLYPSGHEKQGNFSIPHGACVVFTKIKQKDLHARDELSSLKTKAIYKDAIFKKEPRPNAIQNNILGFLPYRLEREMSEVDIDAFISLLGLSRVQIDCHQVLSSHQTKTEIDKSNSEEKNQAVNHPKVIRTQKEAPRKISPLPVTLGENERLSSPIQTVENHDTPKTIGNKKNYNSKRYKVIGFTMTLLVVLGLVRITPWIFKTKLSVDSITIGILSNPESYKDLADYIEGKVVPSNLWDYLRGDKIPVVVDGDRTLSYQEARNRINDNSWDIAFTLSPVLSIAARDARYTWAVAMFPNSDAYQSGIFVRSDSPIRSIDDIDSRTVIALGGFDSASSFYYPVFDLFGKQVTLSLNHRGSEIVELVQSGQVDVGAAAFGDAISPDDSGLRLLHLTREIPGSGVYLSPKNSEKDRIALTRIMVNAPLEVKEGANYGQGEEPNYVHLNELSSRVQELLICSDFSQNPVNLFCPPDFEIQTIHGNINGFTTQGEDYIIRVVQDNEVYDVRINRSVLFQTINTSNLADIQGWNIEVSFPKDSINSNSQVPQIKITQPRQVNIKN